MHTYTDWKKSVGLQRWGACVTKTEQKKYLADLVKKYTEDWVNFFFWNSFLSPQLSLYNHEIEVEYNKSLKTIDVLQKNTNRRIHIKFVTRY